jgi:hypothetical protein
MATENMGGIAMKRRLILLVAITALAFFASISPGQAALTDNLIGYWAFDGTGTDGSGNGRAVNLFGSATYGAGLFGQALSLPGLADSYAARPVNDTVFNFGSSDFTVQVWGNFNTLSGEQVLIEKLVGDDGPGWTVTKLSDNEIRFGIDHFNYRDSGSTISTVDQWHQVVVRRADNNLSIFLDDIEAAFGWSVTILDTINPLFIGRRNIAKFPVDGRIDEAAIWSRALTDSEIAFLWNSGDGRPVIPLPPTVILLGSGLAGLAILRKRLS